MYVPSCSPSSPRRRLICFLLQNMRKAGNAVSNNLYNPDGKKPPVPIDIDEADSVMERFIRQKYVNRAMAASKRRPGGSDLDDTPPPLPPKTPSRLGMRSASSIFPLGSKAKKANGFEPTSPRGQQHEPPLRSKSSGLFGVTLEREPTDVSDTERKLAKLRDMGFPDDHKNSVVLKGVGGSLEKAVEALVRLGEGSGRGLTPARASTMPITRSLTPGASLDGPRARPISPASTNPFDMLDNPPTPQPLSSQSTGTLQTKNPYLPTNPFGAPSRQAAPSALDLAFQNMSLAPPSQPLFPNHTGGIAQQQQNTQVLYQQPMSGPLTAPLPAPGQGYAGMAINGTQPYQPQAAQAAQPVMTGYNPFLPVQPAPQQSLSINTNQFGGNLNTNPFTRSPTRIQSPTLSQIPEQTQQNFYAQQPQSATNPFFAQMAPPAAAQPFPGQMQMQFPQQQQHMGFAPQMTGYMQQQQQYQQPLRPDTASIMALYSYPQQQQPTNQTPSHPFFSTQDVTAAAAAGQMTPAQTPTSLFPPSSSQQQQQQQQQQQPSPFSPQYQQQQQQQTPVSPGLGMGMGMGMGNKNPFASAGAGAAAVPKKHNVSRESMMAVGLEWSNGRHSPDAFASLSARDGR